MASIKFVVFDVGGVLVELRGGSILMNWTHPVYSTEAELHKAWILSESVRQFERGELSAETFAAQLVKEFLLPASPAEFLEEFVRWPNGLFPGAKEMLSTVKKGYSIACLSNTNVLHWLNQKDADYLNSIFDTMFLSYEMGMVKPDRDIYDEMIKQLQCDPDEVLFIDDNQVNIDGARHAGVIAHLAKGVDQVSGVLQDHGCL